MIGGDCNFPIMSSTDGFLVLTENARLSLHQQTTGGYYGLGIPILFLRGSSVQKLPDRFRAMSGFGDGKYRSEKWWKAFGESASLPRFSYR